jgi:DNA-binding NarL/FixJ family response regulator
LGIDVLIVDDEPLVRGGIAMLLSGQDDVAVVGQAGDGDEALETALRLRPTVVLMDLRMPGRDGISTIGRMTEDDFWSEDRPARILALTTFDEEELVHGALRAGADGFLVKDNAPRHLLEAVRTIATGRSWLDPTVSGHVIAALRGAGLPGSPGALLGRLTPREIEILSHIAQGRSNADIARLLVLSEATVRTHVSRILMKTGVGDRASAVVLAYQSGLVKPAS